jgi:hypothetical protein
VTGPTFGDVLVAKPSARVEHQLALLPAQPGQVYPSEASAIAAGARIARELRSMRGSHRITRTICRLLVTGSNVEP